MRVRIGVLPSLVTLGNLMCGFAAIGVAARAQLHWAHFLWETDTAQTAGGSASGTHSFALAGALILLAMIFDALDGRIARLANLTSEFGAQLDSLCDMVSFGIAPAYIVFLEVTSREPFGRYRYAWVCAVLFAICAALRLARFNVETEPTEESHRYFRGLPTPAAAGVIASLAIFDAQFGGFGLWTPRLMPFVALTLGALMISRVRYIHLFNMLFRERKPFTCLALVVFILGSIVALGQYYVYILLGGFAGYVVLGPVGWVWGLPARRRRAAAEDQADAEADTPDDPGDEPAS